MEWIVSWILSITTYLANSSLGWMKGSRLAWTLWGLNGVFWISYSLWIKEYGLILLSALTVGTAIFEIFNIKTYIQNIINKWRK